jgi:hypothetical protein
MKFSERKGIVKVSTVMQTDGMSEALRNSLWNVLLFGPFSSPSFVFNLKHEPYAEATVFRFGRRLWAEFFKRPVDTVPSEGQHIFQTIREFYFHAAWYEVYDFIEWVMRFFNQPTGLEAEINRVLEMELAGYRLVKGVFADITGPEEVAMLQEALEDTKFAGVTGHLKTALEHLSRKEKPDYRNSIKESISAVEAMARVVAGDTKATLGDALKTLEAQKKIHVALKEGFSKLYGYTSDEGGIRHAMLDEPEITVADAKYFLLSCTSFVNYLKSLL